MTQIIAFGQTSQNNTFTASPNGTDTATTFTVTSSPAAITQLLGLPPIPNAFFSLNATSIDPAQTVGGAVIQHYSGNFCVTSAVGCGGADYLSGNFTDAAFGALGGPGLVVNVNNPPDALTLTSSVVPAASLAPPSTFDLSLSNLTPDLATIGTTIAGFTASFAGDASSSIPEPSTLILFGIAAAAAIALRRWPRQARE